MDHQNNSVRVSYYGSASYSELDPLLQELRSANLTVHDLQLSPISENDARGGPFPFTLELALDFAKAGGAVYAAGVIAELGKDHYQLLRQRIVERRSGRDEAEAKSNFPLSLKIGTTQFYIDTPMSDKELGEAFVAAASLVREMSDDRVHNPSGSSGWPITWDANTKSWRDPLST